MFHEEDLAYVGVHTPYTVLLCCDREVLDAGACEQKQLGYTALTSAALRHVNYRLVHFDAGSSVSTLEQYVNVSRTGLHYVIFVNCNESHAGDSLVSGRAVWRNPAGFLSGSDVNFIFFYSGLSAVYCALGVAWSALLYIRRQHAILLQFAISLLFFIGALSCFSVSLELSAQNDSGIICVPCTLLSVFSSSLFGTMLRFFALVVALGLSIVVPWWGLETPRQRYSVLLLTLAYFVVSFLQAAVSSFSEIGDSSGRRSVFLLLPLNILNSCFFVWVFLELVRTIHTVREDGDRDKNKQYVAHLLFLFSATGAALFFYIVQLLVQWRNANDASWTFEWVLSGGWDIMMLGILCVFAILWWPSEFIKTLAFRPQEPFNWRRQNDAAAAVPADQQQANNGNDDGDDDDDDFNGNNNNNNAVDRGHFDDDDDDDDEAAELQPLRNR